MTPSLTQLDKEENKLIMIGGKGGVGKTTCAAALALHFSESGRKTLVISSDPTPSLSDIFETSIGDKETAIQGIEGLFGIEISSDVVLEMWRERFGPEIYEVISSFATLDYDFVDYIGTAPGIEEEYMLNYILDLVEGGQYDLVVWDTAPAGHTLRLLHLPHIFLKHLEAATKFYLNIYSYFEKVKDSVRLRKGKRSLLEIISNWENLAEKIVRFIRDQTRTSFVLVTIPEALGVRQTERIIKDFDDYQLRVRYLIINHVIENVDCSFHEIKQKMQQMYLRTLQESYGDRIEIVHVAESPQEVKGIDRIREVSETLFPSRR
ncbi:MAG: TRC40/GET3/ArsA family transport-energizing ATPase [Proteobacteria bacterium]|nr:TRC40/GET3/ArsA family transport-energizing ATPase [Pseudomonadota bacterium]